MGLFSKPKAPKPPDLIGAANAQGEINRTAATDVMNANRYGQVGPEGSTNQWITDPVTGAVNNVTAGGERPMAMYNALMDNGTSNINAFQDKYWGGGAGSPAATAALGNYYGGSVGGGGSAGGGIPGGIYADDARTGVGGVGGGIQGDLDYSSLGAMPTVDEGARQQVQDALYGRSTGYMDPQWQQQEAATRTRLSNMGLVPGTKAYNNAFANEQAAKEKAYTGARQDAITGGGAEQQRLLEMALALRGQGKSEIDTKGGFHNAAQGQRAGQLLTDIGQQRSLEGTLAGANASMFGSSMAAKNAADRLGLDTRSQEYNEAMGMGKGASAFLPQFGISQGNMTPYAGAPVYNATQNQYTDALSQFQANKNNGGLTSMIPGIGQWLGNSSLGKAIPGVIGSALGIGV